MPISADRFDDIDPDDEGPAPETNARAVLDFLAANPDQAFTQSELVETTGVAQGSIGPTLVRLRERGRVDHRGRYWRISDHERSVGAAAGHANEVAASREDETFAYDQWQEYASDPRKDRE
jgi:predicted transcriptional regulator of viral defense system